MAEIKQEINPMVTILGPTATGKTCLAARVAERDDAEIISADSRQVYRGMNLGTGKDYEDYLVNGKAVPCHLVDIAEPGTEYNVYHFVRDFRTVYERLINKNKKVVLCGGTGMYIDAVLRGYRLDTVPIDEKLRKEFESSTQEDLNSILLSYGKLHNSSDLRDRERTIRAIELKRFKAENNSIYQPLQIKSNVYGILYERDLIRKRITERLKKRLDDGMAEEVKSLLEKGVPAEKLLRYGLEYRYVTLYVLGDMKYEEMFRLLNIAIHQFSKRQMTWFRRMERIGISIQWLDGNLTMEEKMAKITF